MRRAEIMTDKERILLALLNRVYMRALYGSRDELEKWRDMQPGILSGKNQLQPGDLVTVMTTITPNAFMVGYVHEVRNECVVLREIGSDCLCNYYNERFLKIDKEILGYEVLEGEEYRLYKKVLKAFSDAEPYRLRFRSIRFDGKTCIISGREMFEDNAVFEASFRYNKKTTIKSIRKLIEQEYQKGA